MKLTIFLFLVNKNIHSESVGLNLKHSTSSWALMEAQNDPLKSHFLIWAIICDSSWSAGKPVWSCGSNVIMSTSVLMEQLQDLVCDFPLVHRIIPLVLLLLFQTEWW